MSMFLYPPTKRCPLLKSFTTNSQKGFAALPLFLMGLVLIILMNFNGFFTHPKSLITDKTAYKASGSRQIDKKGLHMVDVEFESPTPTVVPSIPTPVDVCYHDLSRRVDPNICTCDFALLVNCKNDSCVEIRPGKNSNELKTITCAIADNFEYCRLFGKEGDGWYCIGKPVIYLYPQKPTYVDVTVSGNVVESIPEYNNGWFGVLAMPGGVLKYNDQYYRELYYEATTPTLNAPDNGVFIKTEYLKQELEFYTKQLGLLKNESEEFVDYWLPRLQNLNKKYIFFSILSAEEKQRTDRVEISPKPDVFIEFIAYFKGSDEPTGVRPLKLPAVPGRIGFTAVEWGGVIDRN